MGNRLHFNLPHVLLTTLAILGAAALVGCNTKSHLGGEDAGSDAGSDAGFDGGSDAATDGGPIGEPCGPVYCSDGLVCCNASCGVCAPPGVACATIACVDAGPPLLPCGFPGSEGCPPDMFCDLGPYCGAADEGGVCQPRPEACPEDCPGVCGCDGLSYCNECIAQAAGTSAPWEGGTCEPPPPGRACGGFVGSTCTDDEYCDFGDSEWCDFADGSGLCEPRPFDCLDLWAPVCGCDGVTYGNECEAHAAGTDAQGEGECAARGDGVPPSP